MVRGVVIAEDVSVALGICVGVAENLGKALCRADNFFDGQPRAVPEKDTTFEQAVMVVKGFAEHRSFQKPDLAVLPDATLETIKVVVDIHQATVSTASCSDVNRW